MFFRVLVVISLFVCSTPLVAQESASPILDAQQRQAVVDQLRIGIAQNYIFPDRTDAIMQRLEEALGDQENGVGRSAEVFASELTSALMSATNDPHFSVGFDPEWISEFRRSEEEDDDLSEVDQEPEGIINHGFQSVAMLEGDIGYIRFDYFANPQSAYETATSAMRFLGDSKALIFDLRYNNGGHLSMGQFLASYLFAAGQEQLIFNYYYNDDGRRIEGSQWSLPAVPGRRLPEIPVVILTSSTSFSSAEWFAYAMQKLERATIIGQTTVGGAHSVARLPINDQFVLQVPTGEISDPVDGTDFEGTGVIPDITASSASALNVGHRVLLERLGAGGYTEAGWLLPLIRAREANYRAEPAALARAAGRYEGRELILEGGTLSYRWRERFLVALQPIADDVFAVEGTNDFRFRLDRNGETVRGLERFGRDGETSYYARID